MLLNIEQVQNRHMHCEDTIIATIATWFKRRYEMIYDNIWSFNFLSDGISTVDSIDKRIGKIDINYSNLEKYHGIHFTSYEYQNPEDLLDFAYKELSLGRPVIVDIDYKYWNWALDIERNNGKYPFIITGIEDKKAGVYCLDIHYLKRIEIITMENFINGCGNSCTSVSFAGNDMENIDWRKIIKANILHFQESDSCYNIKKFADSIDNLQNSDNDSRKDDFNPFTNLHDVCRKRGLYPLALKCLAESNNLDSIYRIYEISNSIGYEWTTILALLIKAYNKKDILEKRGNIANRIRKIADLENDISCMLLDACKNEVNISNKKQSNEDRIQSDEFINEIKFINIRDYANYQWFLDCVVDMPVDSKRKYLLSDGLPNKDIWEFGKMKFCFPELHKGLNDSIECLGQRIEFSAENCNSIMLLGSSGGDYDCIGKIIINFEDGENEEITIEFLQMWYAAGKELEIKEYQKDIAWRGKVKVIKNGVTIDQYDAFMYAKMYWLKHRGNIKSINLPDCSEIHLFAISFGM